MIHGAHHVERQRGLAMMGRLKQDQGQLFYSFCLDEAVPGDHRVREIAAVLDLSWVHAELAPYYPSIGRPSIDPVLMIRMLILGYVFAIRSERLLCREVQGEPGLSLVLRPEHRGQDPGPLGVLARPQRALPRQRHLPACVRAGGRGVHRGRPRRRRRLRGRCQPDRGGRQQAASIPGKDWDKKRDPETASRAVKEYLATLDDAAFGAASDVTPKFVSPSDPAAQWTGAMRGPAFFAYADNYLIDVKFGIIMDVEASRAIRQAEVGAAKTMIERTEERFGIKPERLAADTAYGSAANLNWLVNEKKIAPAYSGHRQVQARGRHLLARGLHLLQGGQRLHLPGVQHPHHDRQDHER